MKINKKKILNNISDNRNIIIGVFIVIFVFCICLFPLIKKATYSSNLYGVSLSCDVGARTDENAYCRIKLEAGDLNIQGFSAKISSELIYKEFKYRDSDWNNYSTTNYVKEDGLVLVSDGTTGSSYIGELVYKMPRDIEGKEAHIELQEVVIVDDNGNEYEIGTLEDDINVLRRVTSTLKNITLSKGSLNETFDSKITEYTANVNSETVKIKASRSDAYSTVSGDVGEVFLEYGENVFEIIVTAEDPEYSTKYTLTIIREEGEETPDSLSTISTLDSITLSTGMLNETFASDRTEYSANVDTDKVIISVVLTDENASISGDVGEVNLEYGENVFEIVVTAEDPEYSTKYTLTIIREEEEIPDELSDVNTLDSITLSTGVLNETFTSNKTQYSANVDSDTVIINVKKTDEKSIVSGDVGEVSLEYGENIFKIDVVSESGQKKTYTITIKREKTIVYEVSFDNSLTVDENNKYINYIDRKTIVSDLLNKINVTGYKVNILDSTGSEKANTSMLATGDVVSLYIDNEIKEKYTISVIGDSSGDGYVDLVDLVQIRKHIVGWIHPETKVIHRKTGVYYNALDFNEDGIIDLIDLVRMRKAIVGID